MFNLPVCDSAFADQGRIDERQKILDISALSSRVNRLSLSDKNQKLKKKTVSTGKVKQASLIGVGEGVMGQFVRERDETINSDVNSWQVASQ